MHRDSLFGESRFFCFQGNTMQSQVTITVQDNGALGMEVEGQAASDPVKLMGILELAKASVSAKLTTPGQKAPSILMPVPNLNGGRK